jgi:hypothetical protein
MASQTTQLFRATLGALVILTAVSTARADDEDYVLASGVVSSPINHTEKKQFTGFRLELGDLKNNGAFEVHVFDQYGITQSGALLRVFAHEKLAEGRFGVSGGVGFGAHYSSGIPGLFPVMRSFIEPILVPYVRGWLNSPEISGAMAIDIGMTFSPMRRYWSGKSGYGVTNDWRTRTRWEIGAGFAILL